MALLIVSQTEIAENSLEHFYLNAFRALGHEVQTINLTSKGFKRHQYKIVKKSETITNLLSKPFLKIPKQVDLSKISAVLFFKCDLFWDPEFLTKCKRMDIPSVIIYPDHPFGQQCNSFYHKRLFFNQFELVVTFSKYLLPVLRQYTTATVRHLSFGYDEQAHWLTIPKTANDKKRDVSMFSNWGPVQQSVIESLQQYEIKVFGTGWEKYLPEHKYCAVTGNGKNMKYRASESAVTLNLTRAEHGCFSSMKTFELPAMGACILTNEDPVETDLFKPTEKTFFSDVSDMKKKLDYLLTHELQREQLKRAAQIKAKPFTYLNLANQVMNIIQTR